METPQLHSDYTGAKGMRQDSERPLGVDEAVRRFDERRRRAVLAGVAAASFSWLVGFLFYALLKALNHRGAVHDTSTLIVQSLYVGTPVFGYLVYRKVANARGILVWLRRFRPDYGLRIRFHGSLARACSAIVSPVTIQDSSFTASMLSATLRAWLLFPFLLILWMVGVLFIGVLQLSLASPLASSGLAFVASISAWTAVFGCLVWMFLKRMGFRTLSGRGGLAKARSHLRSLREGRRGPGIGVEVLRCDDDIWKDVVSEALSQADVAVIDVTEPTENVIWELAQARNNPGEDSLLLVCEAGSPGEAATVSEVSQRLASSGLQLRPEWIERALVTYPAAQAPLGPGRGRQYAELAQRLRSEIARRVVTR